MRPQKPLQVWTSICNVIEERIVKQIGVLRNHADCSSQTINVKIIKFLAVDLD